MEREIIKLRNLYEERVVKQTISFNLYQSLYDNRIEDKKLKPNTRRYFFLKYLLST